MATTITDASVNISAGQEGTAILGIKVTQPGAPDQYSEKEVTLLENDKNAILAILTPYLT
jgi:hypothetical protein